MDSSHGGDSKWIGSMTKMDLGYFILRFPRGCSLRRCHIWHTYNDILFRSDVNQRLAPSRETSSAND